MPRILTGKKICQIAIYKRIEKNFSTPYPPHRTRLRYRSSKGCHFRRLLFFSAIGGPPAAAVHSPDAEHTQLQFMYSARRRIDQGERELPAAVELATNLGEPVGRRSKRSS
jgi:hypothetical protein